VSGETQLGRLEAVLDASQAVADTRHGTTWMAFSSPAGSGTVPGPDGVDRALFAGWVAKALSALNSAFGGGNSYTPELEKHQTATSPTFLDFETCRSVVQAACEDLREGLNGQATGLVTPKRVAEGYGLRLDRDRAIAEVRRLLDSLDGLAEAEYLANSPEVNAALHEACVGAAAVVAGITGTDHVMHQELRKLADRIYTELRVSPQQCRSMLEQVVRHLELVADTQDGPASAREPVLSRRVFIIHGHDYAAALELRDLVRAKLHMEPVLLAEEAWQGRTVIEKFEQEATTCGFALAVLTPDDVVAKEDGDYAQMRPNVAFELGWFHGKLGRDRTCIVYKDGTTRPSDLAGIGECRFRASVREAYLDIEKEIGAAYGGTGV